MSLICFVLLLSPEKQTKQSTNLHTGPKNTSESYLWFPNDKDKYRKLFSVLARDQSEE